MSATCQLCGLGNRGHKSQGQERILHLSYLREEWFWWTMYAVPRKGQACSITQKCQGEWEAITSVIRTLLLTFKNRSFRRGWYWKPHCSESQGRCIWGKGGSLIGDVWLWSEEKCNGADESFWYFCRRKNVFFWRWRLVGCWREEVKYFWGVITL